ncbi:MAG: RtcB family protein [Rhodothermaceae bacterium]
MSDYNLTDELKYMQIQDKLKSRVPVKLFLDKEFLPEKSCLEKLFAISEEKSLISNIVVLPDIFCKNKNYIPGGVALTSMDTYIPKFCGSSNDSMMLFKLGIEKEELSSKKLDDLFSEIRQKIDVYRRKKNIIDKNVLWELLTKDKFFSPWAGIENLFFLENFNITLSKNDIKNSFPKKRPKSIPDFIPWHTIEEAGLHTIGVLDGNSHFIEFCEIVNKNQPEISKHFELESRYVYLAIHAGSADVGIIGHKQFLDEEYKNKVFHSGTKEFEQFEIANIAATRFGYANRLCLATEVLLAIAKILGKEISCTLISDAPHDFVKKMAINGKTVIQHRKGAVEALPKDFFDTKHMYGKFGKPFFFPTAPGNNSYIMINSDGNQDALFTSSHGAGRTIDMEKASLLFNEEDLLKHTKKNNCKLFSFGKGKIASNAPSAFKSADKIKQLLKKYNLSTPVCELKPIAIIKT